MQQRRPAASNEPNGNLTEIGPIGGKTRSEPVVEQLKDAITSTVHPVDAGGELLNSQLLAAKPAGVDSVGMAFHRKHGGLVGGVEHLDQPEEDEVVELFPHAVGHTREPGQEIGLSRPIPIDGHGGNDFEHSGDPFPECETQGMR